MFYVIDDTVFYEYDLKPDGKIKIVTSYPLCGTNTTYEDYPGKKINVVCSNCGNKGIVSIEESKKKNAMAQPLFSAKKRENQLKIVN